MFFVQLSITRLIRGKSPGGGGEFQKCKTGNYERKKKKWFARGLIEKKIHSEGATELETEGSYMNSLQFRRTFYSCCRGCRSSTRKRGRSRLIERNCAIYFFIICLLIPILRVHPFQLDKIIPTRRVPWI